MTAVAFSRAQGIFHPYYVSALAPFTALLVGAGWSLMRNRAWAPLLLAGGIATELVVIANSATDLDGRRACCWSVARWPRAAIVFAPKLRTAAATAAIGLLLLAPASWAVQTVGHATSSTFPAGGPTSSSMGMGGGPGGGGGTPPSGNGPGGPGGGGFAPGANGAAGGATAGRRASGGATGAAQGGFGGRPRAAVAAACSAATPAR